jgi:2-polyprenyl-3-methyl-5-hydroxy-6-metoxy-1,4-benzoquinol methylase
MLIKPIQRSCLVCGCSDFELVHQNQLATLDGIDLSSRIGLCNKCGLLQAYCLAPPEQYNNYYQRLSKTDFSVTLSPLDEARICEAVKLCQEHIQPGAKVADMGCGSGDLLARLQINGFCPVLGIDPGAGSALQAERQHGLTVVEQGFIGEGMEKLRHAAPDLVMMMAVLEHLWDARSNFDQLAAALKPGAMLILEVPAIEGMEHHLGEPLGEFSIEHIQFFSARTLKRLMGAAGLKVLHTRLVHWPDGFGSSLFAVAQRPLANSVPSMMPWDNTWDKTHEREIVLRYSEQGRHALQASLSRIPDQGPLVIYGAGAHTARLLPSMPSKIAERVICLVDGNPNLHGKQMGQFTIEPPLHLAQHPEATLVISSYRSQESLAKSLAQSWPNAICRLYPYPAVPPKTPAEAVMAYASA